ncbi:Uncharacterized protein APZ42_011897, partial [Daphnia magna]
MSLHRVSSWSWAPLEEFPGFPRGLQTLLQLLCDNIQPLSTRGASTSNLVNSGGPTDAMLSAGGWSSQTTYTRFYRRPAMGNTVAGTLQGN